MIRRQAETIIDNDVIANNCQIERIRNNSMIRQQIEAIIDNNVIENILARQEQVNILIPSPISPIPNTTIGSESEKEEEENTEEEDEEASKEREEGEEQENTTIPQAASKSPGSSTTTDTTISSSSDSMHSAQNSSLSLQVDFPNDREKHDNQSNLDNKQQPMQIHNNDINFLEEINNLNRARGGKLKTVISSIRPSF